MNCRFCFSLFILSKKEKIKLFCLIFSSTNQSRHGNPFLFMYCEEASFALKRLDFLVSSLKLNLTKPNRFSLNRLSVRFGPFSSKNSSPSSVGILGLNRTMNTPKYRNSESDETNILQHIKIGITNFGFHAQKPG